MRSMEILSKPALYTVSIASKQRFPVCPLSITCKRESSKDCTPMLIRLMPRSRYPFIFSRVIFSGLASRVISPSIDGKRERIDPISLGERSEGVPPPR